MKIILKYLKPYWHLVLIIAILLAIRAGSELFLPFLMAEIVNNGVASGHLDSILLIGGKMLGVTLIGMLANIATVYIASTVTMKIATVNRDKVLRKILSFSSYEINEFGVASLITRSTNDITQIQNMLVMFLRLVIYSPILAIGGVVMVIRTNSNMTFIIIISVILLIGLVLIIASLMMPRFQKMQKLVDDVNRVSREMLTGILVVRAFGRENEMEDRFDKTNKTLTSVSLFINRLGSFMQPLMALIMNFTTVAIVWFGAKQINNGQLQVGDMMSFIQYAMLIIMAFLMLSMVFIMIPRAIVSAKRIEEVLNKELSIVPTNFGVEFDAGLGKVEFKDVTFKYPLAEEAILKNLSFVAEAGKTTAFIGSTGSGKSTLINLIPRFYDASEGQVIIDGKNIKDVTQNDLHKKIGFVPQKGILFSGTIASNIKYGNKDMSDEDMIKAADIAQAKDFIEVKEFKYDEPISQGGTNVSGGQRQRLSIARAIAINPEILIFDDSFSALDYKTDKLLRKKISEELKGKTILIVAQRINTIINADKIIVLDEGEIVGQGTHSQLLNTCAVYQEIANSQLSKEELLNA